MTAPTVSRVLVSVAVASAMVGSAAPAGAIALARMTRHGYILVDGPGGTGRDYRGRAPQNIDLMYFASEVTRVIGRPPGPARFRYLAIIQQVQETTVRASYFGMRNDIRGIGLRGFSGSETFDYNRLANTAFTLNGVVFLNALSFFSGLQREFTRDWVCPQEFGHRWGTTPRITALPSNPNADAGSYADGFGLDAAVDAAVDADVDGSVDDAPSPEGGTPDAVATDVAPPRDAGPPGPQAPDILLGRQRAHWSYFVHSGGSPMEGNNWIEVSPGVFRAGVPSRRFSPVDQYFMGFIPASEVPPFFVIVNPDVMGQTDLTGAVINRESPPELSFGRDIVVRGQRVTYTINDVLAANGMRDPPYRAPDAGLPDGGAAEGPDMDVVWILLTTEDRVSDILADQFDRAVDLCGEGFMNATTGRARLISNVGPPDAGVDSGVDADLDVTAATDASVGDGGSEAGTGGPRPSGCGCSAPGRRVEHGAFALVGGAVVALTRRRRRARSV